jgi:hypothetical protein
MIVGGGVVSAVSVYAFANLIDLLIDVELNTRESAENTKTISLILQRPVSAQPMSVKPPTQMAEVVK